MKNNSKLSKNICVGVLAHVDAGKTTLSEQILYRVGATRKLGRVDHGDAFLDFNSVERNRGITVYSKEARFSVGEKEFTFIDTPGHVDLGAEMERVLGIIDYAILVVSGTSGVQSHTVTLWRLFENYEIPCFVFVNKMDSELASEEAVMLGLRQLSGDCISFKDGENINYEDIATVSEEAMESYLKSGSIADECIARAIAERKLFPVFFGSALKGSGIEDFVNRFAKLAVPKEYREDFGARVYKITRDPKGKRLTHLKITGGQLETKMPLLTGSGEEKKESSEKVEQIRIYRGLRFDTVPYAEAGKTVAVTGLDNTYAGQGLGFEADIEEDCRRLRPALKYTVLIPEGEDSISMLDKLRQIEEEDPTLSVDHDENTGEIHVDIMGDIEIEILKTKIADRFGIDIEFGEGKIIYKETISGNALGIGHFEPLRHYAEVHLLLEPLPRGSGIEIDTEISEDILRKSWQNLAAKYIAGKRHRGVLTGSEITDIRISLLGGKTHLKHTVGGDFRQAVLRAVRQGLRRALSEDKVVLLEPMLSFTIELPKNFVGRVMTDIDRLKGKASVTEEKAGAPGSGIADAARTVISGEGPLSTMRAYQRELRAFTGGEAIFSATVSGYGECHNTDEIVEAMAYNCDNDKFNPCGSVFTEHGAGVNIEWDMVDELAHFDSGYKGADIAGTIDNAHRLNGAAGDAGMAAGGLDDELGAIFERTYGKSKRDAQALKAAESRASMRNAAAFDNFPEPNPIGNRGLGESYLLIDAYNVMFAWDEFSELIKTNIDAAREAFIEIMMNYQGYKKIGMTLVFDGYKLRGNIGSEQKYGNLNVVYTKEARTADRYIEEYAFENGSKYDLTVVSSDRSVQMSAYADGTRRMSAREFHEAVISASDEIREKLRRQVGNKNRPFEGAFGSENKNM